MPSDEAMPSDENMPSDEPMPLACVTPDHNNKCEFFFIASSK